MAVHGFILDLEDFEKFMASIQFGPSMSYVWFYTCATWTDPGYLFLTVFKDIFGLSYNNSSTDGVAFLDFLSKQKKYKRNVIESHSLLG